MIELISKLLFSKNQAHVYHWQASFYSKHIALDSYYNDITPLLDKLVETYQGTNDIIKVYTNNEKYGYGEESVIPYFEELLKYVQSNKMDDSDLQNIIDEIVSLIKQTLYKLKRLK